MSKIFVSLYVWFNAHKTVFYTVLVGITVLFGIFAVQVRFNENVANFFSKDDKSSAVFDNVKIKDRIVVMVSGNDPDLMIEAGEQYADSLESLIDGGLVSSISRGVDENLISSSTDFIYEYLPVFLEDQDYERIDSCLNEVSINSSIENSYRLLTSPSGFVLRDMVLRDPLSIGTHLTRKFERFSGNLEYELYAGHIFSKDIGMMLMFIEPAFGMGSTGSNADLVETLEIQADNVGASLGVEIECVGGPIVAVHNANQIKRDTSITLSLALLVIIVFILLSFRNRKSVPLIVIPPLFGALFALAVIYFIQGQVSAIAIGAGAVVLGISLSYSIHVISHSNHTGDPKKIIDELATPLTVGSLTTIGAFAALIFTKSPLLRDMGLFSVFCLIGTTLFSLIFLPHFIKNSENQNDRFLHRWIEKLNGTSYEKNKWLIALISLVTVVCLFFYQDVEFDSNMNNINYMPEHVVKAEQKLSEAGLSGKGEILVACASEDLENASDSYIRMDSLITALQADGSISEYISIRDLLIPPSIQQERIKIWEEFWSVRKDKAYGMVQNASVKCGFRRDAFSKFEQMLNKDYSICDYSAEVIGNVPALSDWINPTENSSVLLSKIKIDNDQKDKVYAMIDEIEGTSIIDRGYYSSKMVDESNNDFNFILIISSAIVFLALLISYGRLELALLSFLPMCISWVIILGLMAMLGIKFNIVNIILATFIFGIGDDFSIFIMDGLLQEYKDGKKTLGAHKTAIFFSAFTTMVGMGAMIFAKHPALKSIAVISVLGLAVVVLVSYTIQPFLFRKLIIEPTKKGGFPYTIGSILNTIYCFIYFLLGCLVARIYKGILYLIPISKTKKKESFHKLLYHFTKFFLKTMITVRTKIHNPHNESFEKPAVIIANHQSFVDILLMLSMHPKVIMLTNNWVYNSPFFGKIVQYADYYHTNDGYEPLVERLRERVNEGYSILVFPEGTRSADASILRFHKGAFYLANELKLDIVPAIIYGPSNICSKKQGFYIKHGQIHLNIMERVLFEDKTFGETYQQKAKLFRAYFQREFEAKNAEYRHASDMYFHNALITNYIYKGPVLEWYMRIKTMLDGKYDMWDRMIPRNAVITDVGCGYGQMSLMLGTLAPERKIIGLDYDEDKILLAQHSFLAKDNIRFMQADMVTCEMPQSDVFLFNDCLHYVSSESQRTVLEHCLAKLNDGGKMIVRDGDTSDSDRQKNISEKERWSTRIIGFNRTTQPLTFVSKGWMQEFADEHGLLMEVSRCKEDDSETIYIFTKK